MATFKFENFSDRQVDEDRLYEMLRALRIGDSIELELTEHRASTLRQAHTLSAQAPSAYVKKKKGRNDFVLNDRNNRHRNRWGNIDEIVDDAFHYLEYGNLPAPSGERW